MRYLVTGASGFLGSHLVNKLVQEGHDVVAFCRHPNVTIHPAVHERLGDITSRDAVAEAANGCDAIFHCAGKVSRRPKDAEELYRVHVEGMRAVVQAAQTHSIRRLVFASTSGTLAVGTDPNKMANEQTDPPLDLILHWPYYRSKWFAEQLAFDACSPTLDVLSIHPSLLLGPGDLRGSSTEDVRLFLNGRIDFIPAGGISFVDARDAAEAMLLAMQKGLSGKRYLVVSCNLTFRAFFERLARIGGIKAPVIPLPRAPHILRTGMEWLGSLANRLDLELPIDPLSLEMAQYFWYADASQAERELGWKPRDPNETLADTVRDLQARHLVRGSLVD